MKEAITSCIITVFLAVRPVTAQDSGQLMQDLHQLDALFKVKPKNDQQKNAIRIDNEIQLILTGGFAFYKKFISPQDALHCAFYPSCSRYALETIESNGVLGIFDAIDRLTRCNGFSPEKYDLYHDSQLFYDPVRKIR